MLWSYTSNPAHLPGHRWSILERHSWAHEDPSFFRFSTIPSIDSPCKMIYVYYIYMALATDGRIGTAIQTSDYLEAFINAIHQSHKVREALSSVHCTIPRRQ